MNQQRYEMTKTLMGLKFMSWAALQRDMSREVADNPKPNIVNFIASRLLDNDLESLSILSAALSPVNIG